jgi:hypothetical protein
MKVWRDHMSFWLISATLMGLLIALQVALKPWQGTEKKLERLIYLPDAEYLKIVSLGYRELIADLLWIQSIQVMGEKFPNPTAAGSIARSTSLRRWIRNSYEPTKPGDWLSPLSSCCPRKAIN